MRTRILLVLSLAVACGVAAVDAIGQGYPARPIRPINEGE